VCLAYPHTRILGREVCVCDMTLARLCCVCMWQDCILCLFLCVHIWFDIFLWIYLSHRYPQVCRCGNNVCCAVTISKCAYMYPHSCTPMLAHRGVSTWQDYVFFHSDCVFAWQATRAVTISRCAYMYPHMCYQHLHTQVGRRGTSTHLCV